MDSEKRLAKINFMPEVISYFPTSYNMPPSCFHRVNDIYCATCLRRLNIETGKVVFACPKENCDSWFTDQNERNDHAHWHHGWCWLCSLDCINPGLLHEHERLIPHGGRTYSCVLGCNMKFGSASAVMEHIEGERCALPFSKTVNEHWICHLMLYFAFRDLENDEKIQISQQMPKIIVIEKKTFWLSDPIGMFYRALKLGLLREKITRDKAIEFPRLDHKTDGVIDKETGKLGEPGKQKKYTCMVCGENWVERGHFRNHLRTGVGEEGPICIIWSCEDCGAGFRWLSGIMKHYEDKVCAHEEGEDAREVSDEVLFAQADAKESEAAIMALRGLRIQ